MLFFEKITELTSAIFSYPCNTNVLSTKYNLGVPSNGEGEVYMG